MKSAEIDFGWFENNLIRGLESDRINGYVTECGLQTCLPPGVRRDPDEMQGDIIGQARQLYCLSRGYMITGSDALRRALYANAECLLENFLDPEDGGCFESAGRAGKLHDERKTSYGNSHVALGLSYAARATGEAGFKTAARRSWEFLTTRMTDEFGGMHEAIDRTGAPLPGKKSQNPIMHHFEAMLSLGDCDGSQDAYIGAETAGKFMLNVLLRREDSVLPEYFRDDWSVLPGELGGCVYVGHMFEWAFFLLLASDRGLPRSWVSLAERFVEVGLEIGFDEDEGAINTELYPEGGVATDYRTFWEQCEAIRVMLRLALLHGRDDLWPFIRRVTEYIRTVFVSADGVWFFKVDNQGRRTPSEGMHRVDYHTLGLCAEVMRLSRYAK